MKLWQLLVGVVPAGILVIGGLLWAGPAYRIYTQEQEGKAVLARAEYSRKAQIEDAKAKLESAKYLNEAANVINSSLSPEYLEYLRIQMQEEVASRNTGAVYFFDSGTSAAPVIKTKTN
jgi:hypothetical protein